VLDSDDFEFNDQFSAKQIRFKVRLAPAGTTVGAVVTAELAQQAQTHTQTQPQQLQAEWSGGAERAGERILRCRRAGAPHPRPRLPADRVPSGSSVSFAGPVCWHHTQRSARQRNPARAD
jgi:hypothetical protein